MQHFLKDLTIMLSGMAFHAAEPPAQLLKELRARAFEGKVRIRTAN
jgi:hypothetical protein